LSFRVDPRYSMPARALEVAPEQIAEDLVDARLEGGQGRNPPHFRLSRNEANYSGG